jgi:hypothetical protein
VGAGTIPQRGIFFFSIMTLPMHSERADGAGTKAANMPYSGFPADFLVAPAQHG